MKQDTKNQIHSWLALGAIMFCMAALILMNVRCASLKYGLDKEYVNGLKAPYYVGTQVNAHKAMSDHGTLPALIDIIPSGIADTGLLPWYLGLYWWQDETVLPGPYKKDN